MVNADSLNLPHIPWKKMSADVFRFGPHFWLILVDWFSNFSFAKKLGQSGSTDLVIKKMKKIILRHGWREQLRTDFGTEFRQRFETWCRRAGIVLVHSSPYHSQGNSRAEKKI